MYKRKKSKVVGGAIINLFELYNGSLLYSSLLPFAIFQMVQARQASLKKNPIPGTPPPHFFLIMPKKKQQCHILF